MGTWENHSVHFLIVSLIARSFVILHKPKAFVCVSVLSVGLCMVGCGVNPPHDAGSPVASAMIRNQDGDSTTQFTISVSPAKLMVATGKSGSAKITTTIAQGFDHALHLSATNVPAGVTVTLNPTQIPAPGSGTSNVKIAVSSTATPGIYSIGLKAADGSLSATATMKLEVSYSSSGNPGANFQGCWYKTGGHGYQAVKISVKNPGTYHFYANLYRGSTCSQWADDFGNGQLISFGGADYIFWFDHFPDQRNMSAFWQVGNNVSA